MCSGAGPRLRSEVLRTTTSSGVSVNSSRLEPAKQLAPPAFRRRELVERVDVEAADSRCGIGELRRQPLDQRSGAVASTQQQAREQAAVPAHDSARLADSDPRRDAKELPTPDRPGNPDVDG